MPQNAFKYIFVGILLFMALMVVFVKIQDQQDTIRHLEIQKELTEAAYYQLKDKCQELLDTCEKWPEEEKN